MARGCERASERACVGGHGAQRTAHARRDGKKSATYKMSTQLWLPRTGTNSQTTPPTQHTPQHHTHNIMSLGVPSQILMDMGGGSPGKGPSCKSECRRRSQIIICSRDKAGAMEDGVTQPPSGTDSTHLPAAWLLLPQPLPCPPARSPSARALTRARSLHALELDRHRLVLPLGVVARPHKGPVCGLVSGRFLPREWWRLVPLSNP